MMSVVDVGARKKNGGTGALSRGLRGYRLTRKQRRGLIMKIKTEDIIAAVVGFSSIIGFGIYTNWQASLFLFLMLWANNYGYQKEER